MYAGELVEQGSVREIFLNPKHPYTVALLRCIPRISAGRQPGTLRPIKGRIPALSETLTGCVFASRCARVRNRCRQEHPDIEQTTDAHLVRCFYAETPDPAELENLQSEPAETRLAPVGDDLVLAIEGLKTYYKARDKGLAGLAGGRLRGRAPRAMARATGSLTGPCSTSSRAGTRIVSILPCREYVI